LPTKGAKEQACFEREEFRSVVGPSVNRSERAWMNDKLMRTASNPGNIGEREEKGNTKSTIERAQQPITRVRVRGGRVVAKYDDNSNNERSTVVQHRRKRRGGLMRVRRKRRERAKGGACVCVRE